MDGPVPLVKNPDRVPAFSQVDGPVGEAGEPGPGIQVVPSMLDPRPGQRNEQENQMRADRNDVVESDGVYVDKQGNSFQYRKGHILPPDGLKRLTRTGDYPEPVSPFADEEAATRADNEPENKAEPAPANKKS